MKTTNYLITILLTILFVSCKKCEDFQCQRYVQEVEYRKDQTFPNQPWGRVRETITSDIEKFSVCTMNEVNDVMKEEVISEANISISKKIVTERVCWCK